MLLIIINYRKKKVKCQTNIPFRTSDAVKKPTVVGHRKQTCIRRYKANGAVTPNSRFPTLEPKLRTMEDSGSDECTGKWKPDSKVFFSSFLLSFYIFILCIFPFPCSFVTCLVDLIFSLLLCC